jgi:hypothetical protein
VEHSLALQTFLPSEIPEKKTKFNYKQQREELSLFWYGTQDSSARSGWLTTGLSLMQTAQLVPENKERRGMK